MSGTERGCAATRHTIAELDLGAEFDAIAVRHSICNIFWVLSFPTSNAFASRYPVLTSGTRLAGRGREPDRPCADGAGVSLG
eukprot:3273286-Rhodomonas_salina.6